MTDQQQPLQPHNQSTSEPAAMEWLHDTLEEPPPKQEGRLGRRFPVATFFALVLGIATVAVVLWLLLGSPPARFQLAAATSTPTATALVVARPTPTPTLRATPVATVTLSLSPTVTLPFEIGDRVVISGTGTRGLRLRAGAGLVFDTLEILEDGDVFFVMPAEDPGQAYPVEAAGYLWWRLRSPDGLIGWTVEDFLDPQALVAETPVPGND